jgi:hypothetical protein
MLFYTHPSLYFPSLCLLFHLTHSLQEIGLLDLSTSVLPHGLGQRISSFHSLNRTLQTAVSSRQINSLFMQRNFRRQCFWVEKLLFAKCFGSYTTLFFGFGCC